jgi:hypothetical protein
MGSNPTRDIDVCVRVSSVFMLSCVRTGFATADPPSRESYRLCVGIRNLEGEIGAPKRAVNPLMMMMMMMMMMIIIIIIILILIM